MAFRLALASRRWWGARGSLLTEDATTGPVFPECSGCQAQRAHFPGAGDSGQGVPELWRSLAGAEGVISSWRWT